MDEASPRPRLTRVADALFTARTLQGAGIAHPDRPDRLVRAGLALRRWGPTPAAGYAASAARTPDRTAIDDELGTVTFAALDRRTNALARSLREAGVGEGDGVGILARNHRGFVESTVACSKLGANALYLNTAFAGPQVTDVVARERPAALIHDEEFTELCAEASRGRPTFLAWEEESGGGGSSRPPTLEDLIDAGAPRRLRPPSRPGKVVILTSGTTGAPKGASRRQPDSLAPAAALLSKIPLRAREPTMIAAPLFHSWGFAHFTLGLALSSTLVLRRRFDPRETLAAIARTRATGLVVVPVMLERILELGEAAIAEHDLGALRVIAASGSALPGELATRVLDRFGDVLYNLYGSTEVAWVTIATPADLRAAPGTGGRPPRGTTVRLYDDGDQPVPDGETGRIFVVNELLFEGYTGGGGKDVIDGLMSTGDVGHFDEDGRLFIDGRDDEMIVSGGENVFPREVEDLLSGHPEIEAAAAIGVPDERFGQRLKAFVVRAAGSELGEEAVKRHVKENLAGYKVPGEVVFVEELPRNATGKVVKRELAEL
ncbi:MAG: fatty-acyl-CoA synthase [Solirubrobacteraceae bacterium]|nr:fatty-acyl-CoA synthase [Solirubrobacteraceae bacterium]